MEHPNLLLTGLLAALVVGPGCGDATSGETPGGGAGPRARSVVLFTVDTLRADYLGPYGDPRGLTPNLDQLAADAVLFLNPYSQATHTHAAMSSMLTGLYPHHSGVLGMSGSLADGVECIAEPVRRAGIATGSFAAAHCFPGTVDGTVWHDGWDEVFCVKDDVTDQWDWDRRAVAAALRWMDEQEGRFFCWIHLFDPHGEHVPPPRYWDGTEVWDKLEQKKLFASYVNNAQMPPDDELALVKRIYESEIRGSDDQLGRVLRYLETRADKDDIAFIFSADHGEELFDTSIRYGHGRVLTEPVLRVPLLVKAPGVAPRVVEDPVETLQVTPTLYELLNLPLKTRLDGRSLLAPEPSRGYAISYCGNTVTIGRPGLRGWMTLDSLPRDPMEEHYVDFEESSPVPWFQAKRVAATFRDDARPYVPTYVPLGAANEAALDEGDYPDLVWKPLAEHLRTLKPVAELREVDIDGDFAQELADMGYTSNE